MHRRKRDIVIELTSLLDVIMILIFMVMNQNGEQLAKNKDLLAEAEGMIETLQQETGTQAGEIDELNANLAKVSAQLEEGDREELLKQLHDAESQLEAYQGMDDIVTILTVKLESQPKSQSGNRLRQLTYGKGKDLITEESWSDDEFGTNVNQLAMFLSENTQQILAYGSDSPTVYIVFSYDPYEVGRDDVQAIKNVVERVISSVNSEKAQYRINKLQTDET